MGDTGIKGALPWVWVAWKDKTERQDAAFAVFCLPRLFLLCDAPLPCHPALETTNYAQKTVNCKPK